MQNTFIEQFVQNVGMKPGKDYHHNSQASSQIAVVECDGTAVIHNSALGKLQCCKLLQNIVRSLLSQCASSQCKS